MDDNCFIESADNSSLGCVYSLSNENSHDVEISDIGTVAYADALELQLAKHKMVRDGKRSAVLLLVEHPPVITMGVIADQKDVLASPECLKSQGIEVVTTDRGGEATYHGPGQIVGYPIVNLRRTKIDVHEFLRLVEYIVISTLADFGVQGRTNGPAGVWVEDKKICSIGIAVRGGVSYHGFALNVNPNLSHFGLINPCGLKSEQITSLSKILDPVPDINAVRERIAIHFLQEISQRLKQDDA